MPGGSANEYDYSRQDPVDRFDLDGRMVRGTDSGGSVGNWRSWVKRNRLRKISDEELREVVIDAHDLKREVLGDRAQISRWNVYRAKGGRLFVWNGNNRTAPQMTDAKIVREYGEVKVTWGRAEMEFSVEWVEPGVFGESGDDGVFGE